MSRTRSILAALGLAATGVAIPTAAATVAAVPPPAVAPKPFSAGTVEIDPSDLADGRVAVTSHPVAGLQQPRVIFSATGDAEVTGTDAPVASDGVEAVVVGGATVDLAGGDDPTDPAEAALADAGGSTVRATLRGEEPDGAARTSTDTVWVDDFRGRTLVSESGEQDLRLQRVAVLEQTAEVAPSEAAALRAEITGGGAIGAESVTPGTCVDVCVGGTVLWTDAEGATHPVDRAPVQIREDDAAGDSTITTVTTDADGHYAATVDDDDPEDATGRDLYVRVLAEGPGFTIAAPAAPISQHIDSNVDTDVPTGSVVTQDLTADNTLDNNTAFAVQASLVFAGDYLVEVNGGLFDDVPVVFPDPEGSFYDGESLHILQPDRWDWDVSLHEYGHFVADNLNIEQNPGGVHSLSENLSTTRGKSVGTRLAWGEGWPTFFAVSALFDTASGAGIPNIGDSRYQDTEDSDIDISLEARATLGEDNERTVMNVLWDLYDSHDDNRDHLALGAQSVWDTLDAADPVTLSAAYARFSPNRVKDEVNCIFTDMNVSPRLDAPATVGSSPPTFRWRRGNGGNHRNNRFSVAFRSAGGGLLFSSNFRDGQNYTPPRATWTSIRSRAGGTVRVSVVGRQVDSPPTGPYRSCTRAYPL